MTIITERILEIESVSLKKGSHRSLEEGACVMELASYIAGEPWSDTPACTCPVIGMFLLNWNDDLPTDADRDRLLKPLVQKLVDTKSTPEVEKRRSFLALDWFIRVYTPKWLNLRPDLASHAKTLRDLKEIANPAGAATAFKVMRVAGSATQEATWDTTKIAAWESALDTAKAAAGVAARTAAGVAARTATILAPTFSARIIAEEEAGIAAGIAAGADLMLTTEWLQLSALDLLERMIAVRPALG